MPVTRDASFDGFPMFSPDGRWLVFASNRGAQACAARPTCSWRSGGPEAGRAPPRAAPRRPAARAASNRPWSCVLALLAAVLALRWGDALRVAVHQRRLRVPRQDPRRLVRVAVGARSALTFHWYRPWSRELHYWTLQRAVRPREAPVPRRELRAVARRDGAASSRWRAASPGAAAAGDRDRRRRRRWRRGRVPLLWVAGVQDLWMLLFSLLDAPRRRAGRGGGPPRSAFALALLSKETAASLPAIAAGLGRCWIASAAACARRRVRGRAAGADRHRVGGSGTRCSAAGCGSRRSTAVRRSVGVAALAPRWRAPR